MILEDFFALLEQQYSSKLPFVAYRKPNRLEIKSLLQNNEALHINTNFTDSGFVFSPFDDIDETVIIPVKDSQVISTIFFKAKYKNTDLNPFLETESLDSKKKHIALIEKGIRAIEDDAFKKVVLSRKETVAVSKNNPITIFKKLLHKYTSAFVYCWYHPKVGLWLGATPETLIKIEGNRFSIMALAGTQSFSETTNVVWKAKEQQEQQFVTDFIVNNISPFVEQTKISETETVKAGNLLHLKTMISAQLKSSMFNLKSIISVLHPTPAVCGLPKQEAKDFILKNEHYNREFYSGFLGELNIETTVAPRSGKRNIENRAYAVKRKSTQLYVNLRCMQLKNSEATIYVGGGITKTSHAESEWEETVAKSLVVKSILE
ncbi:chorismate-binding protein [Postechiella marina]|uniref:Chorismate-binding protein n=1 Tax=Postechiella marina TaxID=943941 RepID=A0ABP8CBQ8_9FLAO